VFCTFVMMCICRVLVKSSRKLAQQYKLTYQEEIPTAQLVQRIANVMQEYTQQGLASHSYFCYVHSVCFVICGKQIWFIFIFRLAFSAFTRLGVRKSIRPVKISFV